MAKKCCLYIYDFGEEKMKTRGNKRSVTLDFFFQVFLFGAFKKKQIDKLTLHGHSYWSTFTLHLVRGPKSFVNCCFLILF